MRITVLCGGSSAERDVSLSSGVMAAAALRERGHHVALVDLFFGIPGVSDLNSLFAAEETAAAADIAENAPDINALYSLRGDGEAKIGKNVLEICQISDIVFLALHGGDGEDGRIQAALDLLNCKYTGTGVLGSTLAMNKSAAKDLMRLNGIVTPSGITLKRGGDVFPNPGFPCVVKPCSGGSSVGTAIVRNAAEYRDAVGIAFRYDDTVLAEQYISGRECSVGVLAGNALPVIEICPPEGAFYDYTVKYQAGLATDICPADFSADVTEKLRRAAESVFRILRLEVYARIDFIVTRDGGIYCLEANTLPGLTPVSLLPQEAAAAGISYGELVEFITYESLKKYGANVI